MNTIRISLASFLYTHKLSLVLGFVIISGIIAYNRNYLSQQLDLYALKETEQEFGATPLAPEQIEKIKLIAQEMGIIEPITIRKMNHKALRTFGYCNAFAYFPTLLTFIPVSNTPFLFVSEGFLEDLSPEEQRFIIGHEMIHIKEQHTRFLNLVIYVLLFVILMSWYFLRNNFELLIQYYITKNHTLIFILSTSLLFGASCIPALASLAYRRHIERVADHNSLTLLKSYDGCIKLLERWEKEFKLPAHNSYFGLTSDHPSCFERKLYCLKLQNESKDNI